ncbi:DUF2254 domain-containing protein [Parasphingorhabdus cellanae]|uniref:DUF2254 domain-containing protein n=1 Tax=Parasphingorhabdus cellanae TaxID=2806553 RepID=A0ABX7T9V7_9SPHN|nr:DUF2254 domain-containing protein [Parasphingorhabdus cellanae]QTD57392.1 DUF2254 domain-containing protein [Parasphingorhabdus cellanae]
MWTRFVGYWDSIRSSYWFIPALMSLGAIILSTLAVEFDTYFNLSIPIWLESFFNNQPDGARAVLSTIAGSMITVAGVVFSITLVTLSTAAAQYGPRLLTNFMRDTTNQITLGTFIATFLYCLLVLRAVQNAPPDANDIEAAYFVPHIALLIGIGFSLCSIAVLIRFIHHVPQSVHISLVTTSIGKELCERVSERFPEPLGQDTEPKKDGFDMDLVPKSLHNPVGENVVRINAKASGYLRLIDTESLIDTAASNDIFIRLAKRPGDFIFPGEALVYLPPDASISEGVCDDIRSIFTIGEKRTPFQDIRFLVQELVEIAARALSPGINDPVTAIACLNWLAAAQMQLITHDEPQSVRHDKDDIPRIYAEALSSSQLMELGFSKLRSYIAADPIASEAALDLLARVRTNVSERHAKTIHMEIQELERAIEEVRQA